MRFRIHAGARLLLVALLGVLTLSQAALAHEIRKVGKITMTVGWSVEPTYTGFRNDVQLFLKDAAGKPILDIGDALKVQVISGNQKTAMLPLDPSYDPDTGLGTKGEFDRAIIPTCSCVYPRRTRTRSCGAPSRQAAPRSNARRRTSP